MTEILITLFSLISFLIIIIAPILLVCSLILKFNVGAIIIFSAIVVFDFLIFNSVIHFIFNDEVIS